MKKADSKSKKNPAARRQVEKGAPIYAESIAEIDAITRQNDDVFLYDKEMNVRCVTPNFAAIYGFDPVGLNFKDIVKHVSARSLDERPLTWDEQAMPRAKVTDELFVVKRSDGTEAVIKTSSTSIWLGSGIAGSVMVWHDVTYLKQAEIDLRKSKERYRQVADYTYDWELWIDPNNQIIYNSPSCERVTGYPPEYFIQNAGLFEKVIHPEDRDKYLDHVRHSLKDTERANEITYRIITNTGEEKFIEHVCQPVHSLSGIFLGRRGSNRDVTVRKQVETELKKRLKESEDRYRTIFETTGASTIIVDGNGTVTLVNRTFEGRSGYSKSEVEGKAKWMEFVAEEDLEKVREYRRQRKINPAAAPRSYECRIRNKNGEVRDVVSTVDAILGTESTVVSFLDITEMKRTEDKLKKREKELETKSKHLEEANTALKVLLAQREKDRHDLEENVLAIVKRLIMPQIERIKRCMPKEKNKHANIIESKLKDIVSPFANKLSSTYINMTPKEVQVAYLIREGFTTRQIADSLNISRGTVEFHRENIRGKLDLKNKKVNLKSHLLTLS